MADDVDRASIEALENASATRIPHAVWINRPRMQPRRVSPAAKAIAAGIVLGLVALAAAHAPNERLAVVPSALADTDAGERGSEGLAGYLPARFDESGFAAAEQPPTF
jgi:hypothetical protein